jgi:cell division transport system permease protein
MSCQRERGLIGRRDTGRKKEGASLSRTGLRKHFNGWLQHHRLSAADSLQRVLDNPGSSLLTWLVIGIALALPTGLNVALDNVSQASTSWDSPAQISLFLQDEVSGDRAKQLEGELSARKDVGETRFISREEALDEFRNLSGFADVLASLDENPLPDLILVTPAVTLDGPAVSALRAELQGNSEVAEAVLDMEWLQRLNSLMELSRRLVLAVGGMLVIGVLLILGNTIRLAIESRRDEIIIIKLVGGSNGFVRRPFLYTGLWYGVGGGALAALLVSAALWFMEEPIGELALLYESAFQLSGLGVMGALNLVILGGLLGLAGAWLAVSRHLVQIEPR